MKNLIKKLSIFAFTIFVFVTTSTANSITSKLGATDLLQTNKILDVTYEAVWYIYHTNNDVTIIKKDRDGFLVTNPDGSQDAYGTDYTFDDMIYIYFDPTEGDRIVRKR